MLQVRTICPRCLLQPCARLSPLHHQAAISGLTFAPEAKWGITWPKRGAPVFHCVEDPSQASSLGSPHVFWLNRLPSRREKCLRLGARTDISHFFSTKARVQTNWWDVLPVKFKQAGSRVKECFFFFLSSSSSRRTVYVSAVTFSVESWLTHSSVWALPLFCTKQHF